MELEKFFLVPAFSQLWRIVSSLLGKAVVHYLNAICCRCRKLQILFHDCLTNGAKPRNVFQEKSLLAPVSALWFSSCRTLYTHLPLLTFPQRWVSFRTVAFMTLMFPMTTEIFGYDVFMDAETAAEFC